jgi:spermidine synthase
MNDSSSRRARTLDPPYPAALPRIVLVLFFLSGACTLVYEVVWVRMLMLVFGVSVFAVSTVLTAFMAGLALGSAWFGRLVDRKGNGLRIYAYLEAGIGLFALAFPFILSRLDLLYTFIYRQLEGHDYLFSLIRFLICFLVLLVPTTLMGGTLPVLSKFIVRRRAAVGHGVGVLYAVNTFGAAAGCLAAVYFLMEQMGTLGATYTAAAANLGIAGIAFLLGRSRTDSGREPAKRGRGREEPAPDSSTVSPRVARLVFWGFALSGFTALGYEVIWTRLLATVLRITTVQSVSTILIVFLFGLAAGGAFGARFVDRWRGLPSIFGGIELLLGLFALGSIAVFGAVPFLMGALDALPAWWGHMLRLFVVAFGVMLVPTFLMGALFPIAGKIHVLGLGSLGRRIGNVYAVNTTGAIFGAFVTGFVLIPFLGTQNSVHLLAWLNIALGAAIVMLAPAIRIGSRAVVLASLVAPALLIVLFLPANHMEKVLERSQPNSSLLFYDEDAGGTVTVHASPDGKRLLKVNGAGEVPTDRASIRTFRLLGTLPFVVHPAPEEVLVIAFGGGITLAAAELQKPRRIDCVEVVPGVFEAARFFSRYNNRVFERLDADHFDVIVDDGRNHVLRTGRSYDVIISDATHPGTTDSWILYTEEFYRLCQKRLRRDGVLAQWLPLHGLTAQDYGTILRTFRTVFPHATVWWTRGYSVLLATPERLAVDLARVTERLGREAVKRDLFEVDLDDPVSFLSALALDEQAMSAFVASGPINTDNRPYISFTDRSRAGTATGLPAMIAMGPFLVDRFDAESIQAGKDDLARLDRRLRARRHTFVADVALKLGDRQRALAELRQARTVDPGERAAARMLRGLESAP